jgi:DNA-binding NarL/FixJ family response regulator
MTGKKKRVIIAEDHRILREGLRSMVSSDSAYEVIGEAEDGLEAVRCAQRLKPDLVLLDLSMPRMNGLDAIKEIRKQCPESKILVLTVHSTDEFILEALKAGAHGYLLKDATHSELMIAIDVVLRGQVYLSPGVSEKVVDGYLIGNKTVKSSSGWDTLTKRERQILKLIAEGMKNKEIADYLCISMKTVERHRANLMEKLDLHNVSALTALAIEKGLVVNR